MYFASVNRGVTFTKAGFYTTGFVILLGLVASGSGYNGLFLAVGFGLSVLTISGLLSERIMKSYDFLALGETLADAGVPFGVSMRARNVSDNWSAFAMENLVFEKTPRLKLWPHVFEGKMESRLLVLEPGRTADIPGQCRGLERGIYREFTVVQRTLYPFGLLLKFKLSRVATRVTVLPARDEAMALHLMTDLRSRLAVMQSDQEFRCHRAMNPRDSLRLVDWKKSAGLPQTSWAIKVYEAPAAEYGILVDIDWTAVSAAKDTAAYERWLASARTVCDVARELDRDVVMQGPGGGWLCGYTACVERLAALPAYGLRQEIGRLPAEEGKNSGGPLVRVKLTEGGYAVDVPGAAS